MIRSISKLNHLLSQGIPAFLILLLTLFLTLYYGFGSYALENMNEGLYGQIPYEMMQLGNYIVPHLNYVPYLEKPPLLYWLIALSYHLFGVNAFAARLIPVTSGALVCLSLYFFARALHYTKAGWAAAIILATSVGFILISRVIIFDMTLTLFFTLALLFFFLWHEKERRIFLWLCYACVGLAFLTKGLLSVVLIPTIAVIFMLAVNTPPRKIVRAVDIYGILIFLLVTIPWLVAASIKQTGFAWDFFINEQVMRFLDKRIPHDYHTGPFYYYLIPLLVIIMPWTILLPSLFKRHAFEDKQRKLRRFLWAWFFVPIIFFSLSKAKAQYYIIIAVPALALLLGLRMNSYFSQHQGRALKLAFTTLVLGGIVFFAIVCIALYNPYVYHSLPENWRVIQAYKNTLFILFVIMLSYGLLGLFINFRYQKIPVIQFLLFAGLIIPFIFFFVADKKRLQGERSEIYLGQYILAHDAQRPVYLYQDYEDISSILYYVKKRVGIIDSTSKDLYFGSTTPDAKGWFITPAEFVARVRGEKAYVVIMKDKLPFFTLAVSPLHFCIVRSSGDVFLLSNAKEDCSVDES